MIGNWQLTRAIVLLASITMLAGTELVVDIGEVAKLCINAHPDDNIIIAGTFMRCEIEDYDYLFKPVSFNQALLIVRSTHRTLVGCNIFLHKNMCILGLGACKKRGESIESFKSFVPHDDVAVSLVEFCKNLYPELKVVSYFDGLFERLQIIHKDDELPSWLFMSTQKLQLGSNDMRYYNRLLKNWDVRSKLQTSDPSFLPYSFNALKIYTLLPSNHKFAAPNISFEDAILLENIAKNTSKSQFALERKEYHGHDSYSYEFYLKQSDNKGIIGCWADLYCGDVMIITNVFLHHELRLCILGLGAISGQTLHGGYVTYAQQSCLKTKKDIISMFRKYDHTLAIAKRFFPGYSIINYNANLIENLGQYSKKRVVPLTSCLPFDVCDTICQKMMPSWLHDSILEFQLYPEDTAYFVELCTWYVQNHTQAWQVVGLDT